MTFTYEHDSYPLKVIPADQWSFRIKAFESYRVTDTHTDTQTEMLPETLSRPLAGDKYDAAYETYTNIFFSDWNNR